MQIIKYKKLKSNQYSLVLSNGKTLKTYEEIILKYSLLLNKNLDAATINNVIKDNEEYDVYYTALNLLNRRAKTKKEIRDYLIRKEYNVDYIDKAITKLVNQNYLNDERYANSYLNEQIVTTKHGPKKVSVGLLNKGVDKDIVNKVMENYTIDIQQEKVERIINTMLKSNKTKGPMLVKNKIITKLKLEGFDNSLITKEVSKLNLKTDQESYKKEYDKLHNKYKDKYSGTQLEYFIKNKLYQKGFKQ